MSQASQSFIDQLEAAVTPAVIGTKKAAKALAPKDFKTSQQDRLADMGTYKRRQKKMEKGLLNQEVEKDESPKINGALEKAFAEDSGAGFEDVTQSDVQIPFLRILSLLFPASVFQAHLELNLLRL